MKEVVVSEDDVRGRLDVFLSSLEDVSRSVVSIAIKEGKVSVNGSNSVKTGYSVKVGDKILFDLRKEETKVVGENIDLNIVYEDEDILVVNKKSGMVVHPGAGNKSGTLVNGLIYHTKNHLSDINGDIRPGIVHRIDKDTSGLLVVSKTNKAHEILSEGFKNKTIKREYVALVDGVITVNKGKIDAPIGRSENDRKKMGVKESGKLSVTNFEVIERFNDATFIKCVLETGRTHQIRVHMAYIGHPVVNDSVYGKKINDYGQMLHAQYIGFNHPITGKFLEFRCDVDDEFKNILEEFKSDIEVKSNDFSKGIN